MGDDPATALDLLGGAGLVSRSLGRPAPAVLRVERNRVVTEYEFGRMSQEDVQDRLVALNEQEAVAARRLYDLMRAWQGPPELCQ